MFNYYNKINNYFFLNQCNTNLPDWVLEVTTNVFYLCVLIIVDFSMCIHNYINNVLCNTIVSDRLPYILLKLNQNQIILSGLLLLFRLSYPQFRLQNSYYINRVAFFYTICITSVLLVYIINVTFITAALCFKHYHLPTQRAFQVFPIRC